MAADCRASSSDFLDTQPSHQEDDEDFYDPDGVWCWYCGGWGHRARRCSSRLSRRELNSLFERTVSAEELSALHLDSDLQSLGAADSLEELREDLTTEAPDRHKSSGDLDDLAPQFGLARKQFDSP